MNTVDTVLADVKLHFAIAHPSFEECYADGYQAAQSEKSETDNPFASSSKESEQWIEGWWAGFYNEEPIYSLDEYMKAPSKPQEPSAANDQIYFSYSDRFLAKIFEVTGLLAVSATVGYQIFDLVA